MAGDNQTQVVKSVGLQTVANVEDARAMADDLVRGAITSLRRPITIPKSAGIDMSAAQDALDTAMDTRDEVNDVIDTETTRHGKAAESQKEAIGREGKAKAEGILADADKAKQEAALYDHFAKMFGISIDPNAEIAQVATQVRQLEPVARAKLRRVQEMQSVGFLDNPMDWLVNQIQLPSAIGDYNQEAAIVNSLQEGINSKIKTGQDAANFAHKGLPTITAAQAKAGMDRVTAEADKAKAIVDENLAKTNVTFAMHKLANDITVANATEKMSSLDLQNEHLKYTSLINEINFADKHSERLLRAAALLEKLEATRGLDKILEQYDLTMGHPKNTTTRYTFEKFAEAQRQNIVAIGAGSVGADPFEGMINWYKSKPGPGASADTVRFFDYLQDKAATIAVTPKIQQLDEKQKGAAISKMMRLEIDNDLQNASKMGSLFYEMTPRQMLQSKSIPEDSHLAKVLKPFTEQSGPVPTDMIIEAINLEYQNPNEAGAAISDYYKRNMQLRNSVMNTSLAGITLPKNYKVRNNPSVLSGGLAGQKMSIDLTRPEEATKYILLKRSAQMVGQAMTEGLAGTDLRNTVGDVDKNAPPPKPKNTSEAWEKIKKDKREYTDYSGVSNSKQKKDE